MRAISATDLLRSAWDAARRWGADLLTPPPRDTMTTAPADAEPRPPERLRRLALTDGVDRTLFEEYAAHRDGDRGGEETGWLLLGLRDGDQALAMATLPAGARRDAGQAHVRFDSEAQALGARVVRQWDRRLRLLGVVHTHPGSLRHPSDGDYRGDVRWVKQLRGGEGVFGIGTADAKGGPGPGVAWSPKPHRQCLDGLCLSWYALGAGDKGYRPLEVGLTLGPDLGRVLRPVWPQLERQAGRLDRLARQQSRVVFDVLDGGDKAALAVTVPLAEPGRAVQLLLDGEAVHYYLVRDGGVFAADIDEPKVDQGFYRLLADLAADGD